MSTQSVFVIYRGTVRLRFIIKDSGNQYLIVEQKRSVTRNELFLVSPRTITILIHLIKSEIQTI